MELLKSFLHFNVPFKFIHRLSRILIELQEDSDSEIDSDSEVGSEVGDSKEGLSLDPVSAEMSSFNE